jgi:hypothetical protein
VSRRGETQAPLGGKPAKLCYRFGPLTPSARSANLIAGNGTKNGFPAPNKEPTTNQKQRLDRKSPIRVRIRFPPAESQERTAFLAPTHDPPDMADMLFSKGDLAAARLFYDQRRRAK